MDLLVKPSRDGLYVILSDIHRKVFLHGMVSQGDESSWSRYYSSGQAKRHCAINLNVAWSSPESLR